MLGSEFAEPPREFSLCPFWFWNDALDEAEIVRQMDDFQAHGVHAFVIHPRVGLPREIGWMSDAMLRFVRFTVEEAARRGMWVVLYDEGMYPSGSSSGQVVAGNPAFRCRGLERRPAGTAPAGATVLGRFGEWEVVERPIESTIRGIHYVGDGPKEDAPPAADLLNPEAVRSFLRHVHERYAQSVGDHFGQTVVGIFTDEPSLLGRPGEPGLIPGTTDIPTHVQRLTGVDLSDRLLELWDETSDARKVYDRGMRLRLGETFYAPLSAWCRAHGLALMGHPEPPDDLEVLDFFDVPGQDLVWRWVLPGPTATEGPQSTQAKCAASAMVRTGNRRNSNELAGAYGHELTFDEFKWLIDWCIVRGTNLFFPHAFYYSVRGPRRDERPPDVGPNSPWWHRFGDFARYCARLCWLNTDSEHLAEVAIPTVDGRTPWEPAKACFQSQIDFVYLPEGTDPAPYRWFDPEQPGPRSMPVESHPDLRVRRVRKAGRDVCIVHNEGRQTLDLALGSGFVRIDPWTHAESNPEGRLRLDPYELALWVAQEPG